MDQSISRREVRSDVMALARSPTLPAHDADTLAALLVEEVKAAPHLSPNVCGALIETAVAFTMHAHDSAIAESATGHLLGRMMSGDGAPHD